MRPGTWILAALVLLCAGCGGNEDPPVVRPDLVGVWLRPIAGLPGLEGYQFEADGTVRFVNMFSIEGLRWSAAAGDTIHVWSRTERYPRPERSALLVVAAGTDELVLDRVEGDGPPGFYGRAGDTWQGRWTGANGDFVDITRDGADWRVVVQRGGDFEMLRGREEGPHLILDPGPGGRKLMAGAPGCLELAGAGAFCRDLAAD